MPAAPPAREDDVSFASLDGVGNDLDAYTAILNNSPAQQVAISRLDGDEDTRLLEVTNELQRHVRRDVPCTCSTLVIVLVGHGFQWQTHSAEEPDRMDEFFALSDQPLIDDWWVPYWRTARPEIKAIVVVDSCHSESVARGAIVPEPVIVLDTTSEGPRRLIISASMDYQRAREYSFNGSTRGVLTAALLDSWTVIPNRLSYEAWYRYAAQAVNQTVTQTAGLRVIDPLVRLHTATPFA